MRLLVDVLVVEHNAFDDAFIKHLLVPVLQPLRLWYLLLRWMAMKDVIVAYNCNIVRLIPSTPTNPNLPSEGGHAQM